MWSLSSSVSQPPRLQMQTLSPGSVLLDSMRTLRRSPGLRHMAGEGRPRLQAKGWGGKKVSLGGSRRGFNPALPLTAREEAP